MRINADFSKPALVVPSAGDWVRSPESGVERLMLDRIGEEVARATSIVRYAAGSSFSMHTHAKGEEFLVLDGVFSDETGDFPTGTYVRNPPGSGHAPRSRDGCRILVKLRQFEPDDLERVVVDTADGAGWETCGEGTSRLPLHTFGSERVEMRRLAGGGRIALEDSGGVEVFVVSGAVDYEGRTLRDESWLRLPAGATATLVAAGPSLLWIKAGHLPAS